MRPYVIFVAIAALLSSIQLTQQSGFCADITTAQDPQAVVTTYFDHLKNGEIGAIYDMSSGRFKKRAMMLRHKGADYSVFLRNHYKNAQLGFMEVDYISATEAECRVHFYNGTEAGFFNLHLSRVNGVWRITDDITE